jgi:hypothetical protein
VQPVTEKVRTIAKRNKQRIAYCMVQTTTNVVPNCNLINDFNTKSPYPMDCVMLKHNLRNCVAVLLKVRAFAGDPL